MVLTEQDAANLRTVLSHPGFELVRKLAQERIDEAKFAALCNTDRTQVLWLWDRAQAADKILRVFMLELEDPSTPQIS